MLDRNLIVGQEHKTCGIDGLHGASVAELQDEFVICHRLGKAPILG